MPTTQFASFQKQLTNTQFSAVAQAGGATTVGGTINLHLSLLNRMGLNLLSTLIAVTYAAGESVAITIPANLISAGEDVHRFIVSGQKSGDEQDAVQLADYRYRTEQSDGTVLTASLPTTIVLNTDQQLETNNLHIADLTAVPVPAVAGMIRLNDAEAGKAYRFEGAEWVAHYYPDALTYISSTLADRGCDRVLGNDVIVSPPKKIGDNDSVRVRYWLLNGEAEGGASLAANYPLNLIVSVNGKFFRESDSAYYGSLFNQLIKFQLVGYYRLINRSLNSGVDNAGVEVAWSFGNPFKLGTALPSGYAAVIDVWLSYSQLSIQGLGIKDGDKINIGFDEGGEFAGKLSPLAAAFGDNQIFGGGDRVAVVPNKILAGSGIVNGFEFDLEESIALDSALADTAAQTVYLDGSGLGTGRIASAPGVAEVLRATISTEAGFGQSSEPSDQATLLAGENLEITLRHPVAGNYATIRGDYPDPLIAGNPKASFQAPDNMLFMAVNGVLYQKDDLIPATNQATQTVTVTSLAGWTQVSLVPDSASVFGADFGLFTPIKPSLNGVGSNSSLAAGSYQLWVLYQWTAPNVTFTRISHNPDLPTFLQSFEQLSQLSKVYSDTLLIDDARAIDYQELANGRLFVIRSGNKRYLWYWDATSTLADDGETILALAGVGTGRFIRFTPEKQAFQKGSVVYRQPTLILADGLLISEDVGNETLTISLDPNAQINPDFLTSDSGDILVGDQGDLILSL